MRTRTLGRAVQGYDAFVIYLLGAQILAITGVAKLPLSFFHASGTQFFLFQVGQASSQLLSIIALAVVLRKTNARANKA